MNERILGLILLVISGTPVVAEDPYEDPPGPTQEQEDLHWEANEAETNAACTAEGAQWVRASALQRKLEAEEIRDLARAAGCPETDPGFVWGRTRIRHGVEAYNAGNIPWNAGVAPRNEGHFSWELGESHWSDGEWELAEFVYIFSISDNEEAMQKFQEAGEEYYNAYAAFDEAYYTFWDLYIEYAMLT